MAAASSPPIGSVSATQGSPLCAGPVWPRSQDDGGHPGAHGGSRAKKAKCCVAPSRSSLCINNLSYKRGLYFGI